MACVLIAFVVLQVLDRDTLTSLAARFDTTPSELTKINRLATPYIFPGQQLYVPLRNAGEKQAEVDPVLEETQEELPLEEKGILKESLIKAHYNNFYIYNTLVLRVRRKANIIFNIFENDNFIFY